MKTQKMNHPLALPRIRLPIAAALFLSLGAAIVRADSPRLINMSMRGEVGTGDQVMIAGLSIGPGSPETVLIRAVGPGLGSFGVRYVINTPVLSLFDLKGNLIQSNQAWGTGNATAAIMTSVGAFPLKEGGTDSALVATLAPGNYTAEISGAGGTTGIALLEVYEVGATATTARLLNLSARAWIGTINNSTTPGTISGTTITMIPGFVVGGGTGSRTLLIRAIGPTLAQFGVSDALTDTYFSVFDSSGNVIAANNNWGTPIGNAPDAAALSAAFAAAGAFPLPPKSFDSATIVDVAPGASYTVNTSGSTGVGLVEVYDITP